MRYAERIAEAQWQHGQSRRAHKSRWVIDTLSRYLPPDHVHLARRLMADQATAEGYKPQDYERVDGAGNGVEGALAAKLDAARKLAGFEGSIFRVMKRGGILCFRCIVEGESLKNTITRCGYAAGSDRSVRELVQLTLFAASDYEEMCRQEAERWNRSDVRAVCA